MSAHVPDPWRTHELIEAVDDVDLRAVEESVLPADRTFRALDLVGGPEDVRVVILGQDPYDKPTKASGLAFGLSAEWLANGGATDTSSFRNIRAELEASTGQVLHDYSLESWAAQGVLLLNTRLSVAPDQPMSHSGMGWARVVDEILTQLPTHQPVTWLAWGGEAARVARRLARASHTVLTTSHPCKFSATRGRRPFLGSQCFAHPTLTNIKWGR